MFDMYAQDTNNVLIQLCVASFLGHAQLLIVGTLFLRARNVKFARYLL